LPILIQNDPEIQAFIMKLAEQRFADKKQTKGRIEQLIEELKRDREEDRRKWEDAKQEDRRQMDRGQTGIYSAS
jgi:hypothetical protein